MSDQKPSKNPFINLVNSAKAAATGGRVSASKASQVQSAIKQKQVGISARPVKKASGRGR